MIFLAITLVFVQVILVIALRIVIIPIIITAIIIAVILGCSSGSELWDLGVPGFDTSRIRALGLQTKLRDSAH